MSANPCEGPDCEQALDKLYLFIDEEMDTASCAEIQTHIDECTSCLSEYDLERVVKSLVSRSCSEVAPEPLREMLSDYARDRGMAVTGGGDKS